MDPRWNALVIAIAGCSDPSPIAMSASPAQPPGPPVPPVIPPLPPGNPSGASAGQPPPVSSGIPSHIGLSFDILNTVEARTVAGMGARATVRGRAELAGLRYDASDWRIEAAHRWVTSPQRSVQCRRSGDRYLCKFLDLSPTEHAVLDLRFDPTAGILFESFLRLPRSEFEAFGPVV